MTLDIVKLRALYEAATPGPWKADVDVFTDDEGIVAIVCDEPTTMLVKIETGIELHRQQSEEWTTEDSRIRDEKWIQARAGQEAKDAAFIAGACTALPELLAEVERLKAAEDEITDRIAAWLDQLAEDLGSRDCAWIADLAEQVRAGEWRKS